MRTADVFAVKKIIYYGRMPENENKFRKIARGASTPLAFTDHFQFVNSLRQEGYRIFALEITDESVPLRSFAFPEKTCLIVGNERHGVCQELLDMVDGACYIEMYSSNISSLNVSISTAIAVNSYMEYCLAQEISHPMSIG